MHHPLFYQSVLPAVKADDGQTSTHLQQVKALGKYLLQLLQLLIYGDSQGLECLRCRMNAAASTPPDRSLHNLRQLGSTANGTLADNLAGNGTTAVLLPISIDQVCQFALGPLVDNVISAEA